MAAMLTFVLPSIDAQAVAPVTAGGIKVFAETQYGNISGRYDQVAGVNRFLGIPVGADTSGANRFKKPQPPTPWTGTMDTIQTKSCYFATAAGMIGTEDCLAIDVVAPAGAGMPGAPVVSPPKSYPTHVWFYGGGFVQEATAYYVGVDNTFATGTGSQKVVSCFPKYRLAGLGGMSHPALRNGISGNQYSGNWMVHDALNALRWVQNNVENFGGDKSMVTIQGQSAGGTLSNALLSSPLTYAGEYAVNGPLITGAALHSSWQTMGNGATYSQPAREAAATAFVKAVGCSTTYDTLGLSVSNLQTIADCLRTDGLSMATSIQTVNLPSSEVALFDAVHGQESWYMAEFQTLAFYPCVDGYTYTTTMRKHLAAGVGSAVKVVVGQTTEDDGPFYPFAAQNVSTPEGYFNYVMNMGFLWGIYSKPEMDETMTLGDIAATTLSMPLGPLDAYYSSITDPYQRQVAALTDGFFAVNHNILLDTLSAQTGRVAGTLYRFVYAEHLDGAMDVLPNLGAAHAYDLTYIWGMQHVGTNVATSLYYPQPGTFTYSAEKLALGRTMKAYWLNFFTTGDPNGAGLATWSPVTVTEKHTMVFKSTMPNGAKLDPCVMFTACLAEPVADYRRAMTTFWTSGFASTPALPTCSGPVEVDSFSHSEAYQYKEGCVIATGPCSSWCNYYTCSMDACTGCGASVCPPAGSHCAGWCNAFTCAMDACSGCDTCKALSAKTYCAGWCNSYTSGLDVCAGC